MKIPVTNYFNKSKKLRFLKEVKPQSTVKRFNSLFNNTYIYELNLNKDLCDLPEETLIDYLIKKELYTTKSIDDINYLFKLYYKWCGKEYCNITAKQVKQEIIKRKVLFYPKDDLDLYNTLINTINSREKDTGLGYESQYADVIVYLLLVYYGYTTEEQIKQIKRTDFYEHDDSKVYYINGMKMSTAVHKFFSKFAGIEEITKVQRSNKEQNNYAMNLHNSNCLLRTMAGNNLVQQGAFSFTRLNAKISKYLRDYSPINISYQNILIAGMFNRAFLKELSEHKFTIDDTIRNKIDYYKELLPDVKTANTLVLAEKYMVYKSVRTNNDL